MSKRIAVIGGGVAGLAAGYLLGRQFQMTLFEKEPRLGGDAYTYTGRDGQQLDIAVAAFGRAGYDHFFRLLAELGVVTRSSAGTYMSFHDLDTRQGIYVTPSLRGLRAQRFRILRPSQLRPFWELSRGLTEARRIQKEGGFGDLTVSEGLRLLPRISGDADGLHLRALSAVLDERRGGVGGAGAVLLREDRSPQRRDLAEGDLFGAHPPWGNEELCVRHGAGLRRPVVRKRGSGRAPTTTGSVSRFPGVARPLSTR